MREILEKNIVISIIDTNQFFKQGLTLLLKAYAEMHGISLKISYEFESINEATLVFIANHKPYEHTWQKLKCRTTHCFQILDTPFCKKNTQGQAVIHRQQKTEDFWLKISLALSTNFKSSRFCDEHPKNTILRLTEREIEVISLLFSELSPTAASHLLNVAQKTISSHKRSAMKKLHFTRTYELHQWLLNGGLNEITTPSFRTRNHL